jgi:hypothetical protein
MLDGVHLSLSFCKVWQCMAYSRVSSVDGQTLELLPWCDVAANGGA